MPQYIDWRNLISLMSPNEEHPIVGSAVDPSTQKAFPPDPLTDLDKFEQVKAAVLHQKVYVYCDDCKYNRHSDCSLTGKLRRTAMREKIIYKDFNEINAKIDCKYFKRNRYNNKKHLYLMDLSRRHISKS